LALTATTAALVPATTSALPTSRHNLVFKVNGKVRQDVIGAQGITITVRCPTEACAIVATAQSKSPSVHTGNVRAQLAAGGSSRLVLPLGEKDSAKLAAALGAGKSPTFTVKATAKDNFGSKVPLQLTVRPVKP